MILQIMTPFSTDYIKTSAITTISTFRNHIGTQTLEINVQDRTDGYARVDDPVFFTPWLVARPDENHPNTRKHVVTMEFKEFAMIESIKDLMFGQGDNILFLCSRACLAEVQAEMSRKHSGA